MRAARLVGLSPDGRYVIVATDRGEELAIAADDRLRAAVRGRPAASEKLEIEMESALSPREIQTRIRSGESVEDVARVAGVDRDRVERFAAPVIAEREHVAGLAMTSSARRRGETSSHRTLRGVLNERLLHRGVDIDTVSWDSYRIEDGRWAVTADYLSGDTPRQALFFFDLPGRYSVSGNDEGRWVLGDVSPSRGPQPGRRPPVPGETEDDTEPTLDLSDELALVRAIQDIPMARSEAEPGSDPPEVEITEIEVSIAEVVQINRTTESVVPEQPATDDDDVLDAELAGVEAELDRLEEEEPGLDALYEIFQEQDPLEDRLVELAPDPEAAEPTIEVDRIAVEVVEPDSPTEDITIEDVLVDTAREDTAREDTGPSDASAVPELSPSLLSRAWEPAIVVDYPVEPSEDDDSVDGVEVPEGSDDPGRPEPPVSGQDRRDEAASLEEPADQPLPLDVPEQPTPVTPPKPARRKRASVPSWDEIVFGGPKDN